VGGGGEEEMRPMVVVEEIGGGARGQCKEAAVMWSRLGFLGQRWRGDSVTPSPIEALGGGGWFGGVVVR
jgi:hypothetical protein